MSNREEFPDKVKVAAFDRANWPSRGPKKGPKAFKDLSGVRFGSWLVTARSPNNYGRTRWLCQCDCGALKSVASVHLVGGKSKSCGCVRPTGPENHRHKHGESDRGLHVTWVRMIGRCENPNDRSYRRYGGRGIKVCEQWRKNYVAFRDHIGPRPSPKHSIDRINNDGNYEPGNVRWATPTEQARNTSRNRMYEIDGQTKSLSAWIEERGANYGTVKWRLARGQSIEESLR